MAPIQPHWVQPSHPDTLEVIVNDAEFTSKSISKIALPPFGVFAKLEFPPCTAATEPTYATVQLGRDKHLDLNSDLLYINHSCEPSLIFDTANLNVIAGPKGLQPGDELTFFYPSTEWYMAQPFDCFCGTPTCRGRIAGARDMTLAQLDGLWLNGHIRELLEEREKAKAKPNGASTGATTGNTVTNGNTNGKTNGHVSTPSTPTPAAPAAPADQTVQALRDALEHAEKVVEAARLALISYVEALQLAGLGNMQQQQQKHGQSSGLNGQAIRDAVLSAGAEAAPLGSQRRGPTSRELSGEMGGDTSVTV